jgi:predicted PurR-regulated permease PerM
MSRSPSGEPLSAVQPWPLSAGARLAVIGVVLAIGAFLLWVVRDVLSPFVVAVILAYVLRPIVGLLCRRTGLPRAAGAGIVLAALVVLLALVLVLLAPAFARELRAFAAALPRLLFGLRAAVSAQESVSLFGLTIDLNAIADEATRAVVATAREASLHIVETLVDTVETVLKSILALVIAFYLLVDFSRFRRAVSGTLPPASRSELGALVNDVDRVLGQFLRAEVLLVIIMSAVTWVSLTVLGIRYALVLALLAGVLELIPFIGPIMAATPAVILGFVLPSPFGWPPLVNAGVVALAYFLLRHAEDYFVIPQVLGRAVELHPLAAMFAAFAGLRLGGILGMFLGVPLAAVLRLLLIYVYRKLIPAPAPPPVLTDEVLREERILDGSGQPLEPADRRVPIA